MSSAPSPGSDSDAGIVWADALHDLQLDIEDAMDGDYIPPDDEDEYYGELQFLENLNDEMNENDYNYSFPDEDDEDYMVAADPDIDYEDYLEPDPDLEDEEDYSLDEEADELYGSGLGHIVPSDTTLQQLQALMEGVGGGRTASLFIDRLLGPNRRSAGLRERWWTPQTEPHPAGLALLRSGEFGPVGPWSAPGGRRRPSEIYATRRARGGRLMSPRYHTTNHVWDPPIPNTPGTVVASYPSVPYVGQFCGDNDSMFYTATRGFRLYVYDMTRRKAAAARGEAPSPAVSTQTRLDTEYANGVDSDSDSDMWFGNWRPRRIGGRTGDTSLYQVKAERGEVGQWTITDAHVDPSGKRLIYSSITPYVHMMNTADDGQPHNELNFMAQDREGFGIWSVRWSADGREIVAGASGGKIMVYDVGGHRRSLKMRGHEADVNAVCFADEGSTNVLASGSDDGYIKIWDRRSLSSSTPAGVLVGATEGITYISPKGDGRYIVANSKDQAARLYDLRKMLPWSRLANEEDVVEMYGCRNFDYRGQRYPPPKRLAHPLDCSVMTYRGHSVLRTLIRCHFSPRESTGQSYIYSGSADGLIHIWSLDGRVVQVLDRSASHALKGAGGVYNDPSAADPRSSPANRRYSGGQMTAYTVRDVSWSSHSPMLMSTCWELEGRYSDGAGSVAMHEWKGLGKGGMVSLVDWVEKKKAEEKR